jgi:integrase/recombinase XerD
MAGARSHKPLPVAEWPALDREAWRNANVPGDEFTQSGIAAQWAPQSRENAELAYGRLLGFLLRKGRLTPVQHVGERIVLDDLRDLGHELSAQLAPHTVRGVYSSLAMAFSAMDPGSDRRQLNQIVARLARTAKSVRDITGNLLSPRELVAIGKGMMDEADSQVLRSSRPASLYRDGLLTMFLALCPLRVGAVSEMQIGLNLIVVDDRATVRFPPEERKKRRIGDVPLPQALSGRFLRYLSHYRPILQARAPRRSNALWLSQRGLPLDSDYISNRIKEHLGRRAGKRFTAHMFRHACATYIVEMAPEQARMVVGVLGHRGFQTGQRHYIKGQQHAAARKHQRAVADLVKRSGGGSRSRAGFPD